METGAGLSTNEALTPGRVLPFQAPRAGAGTVSEIAYGVGFKSVAHFSNAFQERFGERPSAFAARWKPSPPRPLP